MQHDAFEYLAL